MAIERKRQRKGGRLQLVAVVLVGWVVVILVGAGRRPDEGPLVGVESLESVLIVVVLLFALFGLVLLIWLNPFQSEWTRPERRKSGGYVILLLLAFALLVWQPSLLDDFVNDPETEEESETDAVSLDQVNEPPVETVAEATDILFLVIGAGVIAAAVIMLRRRISTVEPPVEETFEAELLVAMEQAQLELTVSGDPRAAVLNAYAVLEAVLAARGTSRAAVETVAEHIVRSLRTLRVDSGPIVRLAELYELARFSDQTITTEQQTEARTALEQARSELAALT